METIEMRINDLQPGDYLSEKSQRHMRNLSTQEIMSLGTPYVYETAAGKILFDGNNRTAVLSKRGLDAVKVKYLPKSEIPQFIAQEVEDVLAIVDNLRRDGIYKVADNRAE